jgi:hypothetical protein
MALLRNRGDELETAGIGNATVHLYRLGASVLRFGGTPSFLGSHTPLRRARVERCTFGGKDVLVAFTDGISSHLDIEGRWDLLRQQPIVVAQRIVEQFGTMNDDALALVVA